MAAPPEVLVIDDETGSRESMAIAIEKAGYEVRTFDEAKKALAFLQDSETVRVLVCDQKMPGMGGIDLLQALQEQEIDVGFILVTGFGSIESAVEAMRVGADDYLTKPVELYELRQRVRNLMERKQLREEVSSLHQILDKRYGFDGIVGQSATMERLYEQMRMVAPTRSSVLIIGESGTGKELVANAIHRTSPRNGERFLAINCGAIPSDILESELFGHERGAFTGAVTRKVGKFELAHKGTLFLDEISELALELQVKLLRVLEERQIMRVGGTELIDVDFRLVAATNRELEKEVEEGKFRQDLYYRLKVVTLELPPLRNRLDDIPLLAEHFLKEFFEEHGKPFRPLTAEAVGALQAFEWRGNVRELRNVLESVVIFHQGEQIQVSDLPSEIRAVSGTGPVLPGGPVQTAHGEPRSMDEIERQAILETLTRTGGHRAEAARMLGIGLRTLQRKIKEYKEQGFAVD
ncbi:MAG: sigma-54 dependent transcriptional regulator [Acidobacteriota bacterium]